MRKIIHVDMDAFYASIEQRDHPEYRGKPVAVGHAAERGVVAAASYEARAFGIRSAMPSMTALSKCPDLIFVPARFDVYREISSRIREIFLEYTHLVEPLSLDEAYLDVTANRLGVPSATAIARELKARIRKETQLTASAGVSFNKFLAKIASDYKKPDGLFVIPPEEAEAFVAGLAIERFWGVGRVTAAKMRVLGIHNGEDLRRFPEEELVRLFGKAGHMWYLNARGIDDREVESEWIRKSLGSEETFAADLDDHADLTRELCAIAEETWNRATRQGFYGRTVTLKVKYADFEIVTRRKTLPEPVETFSRLREAAFALLDETDCVSKKIRLMGLTLSNIPGLSGTEKEKTPSPSRRNRRPSDAQLEFDFEFDEITDTCQL